MGLRRTDATVGCRRKKPGDPAQCVNAYNAEGVAAYYNTTPEALLKCTRGPQHDNEPCSVATYQIQDLLAARLAEIAGHFNLNHYGSVGFSTHQIRQRKKADSQFDRKLSDLIKGLIKSHR